MKKLIALFAFFVLMTAASFAAIGTTTLTVGCQHATGTVTVSSSTATVTAGTGSTTIDVYGHVTHGYYVSTATFSDGIVTAGTGTTPLLVSVTGTKPTIDPSLKTNCADGYTSDTQTFTISADNACVPGTYTITWTLTIAE
jgi:hypothetical protein